jgi:hypothetical protein
MTVDHVPCCSTTVAAKKLGMHCEKDVMLEGYTHPDRLYAIGHGHS